MKTTSRALLAWLAIAGCGRPSSPPAPEQAAAVVDAAAAPAPVTWRGPNLYTLVGGEVTVGVTLRPPGGWEEDATDDHEQVTSPSGSTLKVWLVQGRPATAPTRTARTAHHEHPVPVAGGDWLIACEVAVSDADAALFDELAGQCADLSFEYEPDDRAAWAIEVEPAKVRLGKLSTLKVRYRVTNRSKAPLDARAYVLGWQVDGVDSMALDLAFGNGGYLKTWRALPAGDSIADERQGVAFVDAPGEHVITLHHLGREIARAALRVTR